MSNFKKLLFLMFIISHQIISTQQYTNQITIEELSQSIKELGLIILDLSKNITDQQQIITNLVKQLSKNNVQKPVGLDFIESDENESDEDHRLTLRIPKSLMTKIDEKRKRCIGKISRNLWILKTLDKATRK